MSNREKIIALKIEPEEAPKKRINKFEINEKTIVYEQTVIIVFVEDETELVKEDTKEDLVFIISTLNSSISLFLKNIIQFKKIEIIICKR
ncbi:MAG: hypothetical protein IJ437_02735 [Clostridia bacterium]|nr:hypothetical protein [Clostridia bacterium]